MNVFGRASIGLMPPLGLIGKWKDMMKLSSSFWKNSRRFYPAPRKRFFKIATVSEFGGEYEINLDKKKLRTPLGNLFKVPNESLAVAVATEWNLQPENLQLQNMHITSLCNTVIDNPCKVGKNDIVNAQLEYLPTDTLCFRQPESEELAAIQSAKWDTVIDWFRKRFDVDIQLSVELANLPVSEDTISTMRNHLMSFNFWALMGLSYAVENLKSLILALALIHRHVDVETAVELSRLEIIFQTNKWGNVEWSHDMEHAQTTAKVAAAVLFVYLNDEKIRLAEKLASRITM